MPGFDNGTVFADNVDFTGSVFVNPQVNADGQLLIGSAVAPKIRVATLTEGTGISITNGAGSITLSTNGSSVANTITGNSGAPISPSGGNWNIVGGTGCTTSGSGSTLTINVTDSGMTWTEVTGTSQNAAVDNGYIANNGSLVTITLPSTFAIGDTIRIGGKGAGLWRLAANTGDTIHFGNQDTSAGGSLTATNRYDAVEVIGITANSDWLVLSSVGNLTVA